MTPQIVSERCIYNYKNTSKYRCATSTLYQVYKCIKSYNGMDTHVHLGVLKTRLPGQYIKLYNGMDTQVHLGVLKTRPPGQYIKLYNRCICNSKNNI